MADRKAEFIAAAISFGLGVLGMTMLWRTTHSWPAMGWGFVAAIHISHKRRPTNG